jgi:alpha-L-rhamnosidase
MSRTWSASMIGPDEDFAGAPVLRKEFQPDAGHGEVVGAVLHATARGVFTASINGTPVSDDVLSPGWSSYEWRLRYRSYDVTDLLRAASGNTITLSLGNGWFRGRWGWNGRRAF